MHRSIALLACLLPILLTVGVACNKSRSDTNKAPIITALQATPAGPTLAPGTDITLLLSFTDPDESDPDPQSYNYLWSVVALGVATPPPNLQDSLLVADANPGFWRTPQAEGAYRLTGRVCDRFEDCAEASLTLTVEAPNRAPRITASNVDLFNPFIGQEVTFTVAAVDDDGDALTWDWAATRGNFIARGPEMASWAGTQIGSATITVTVTDPLGASDSEEFVITVQ